ncbi:hypothetical protein OB919_08665 [Halobacteria archaeon AArc-curdl1]|uniref:Uncharacterized protein n=1 Tax=Natronosalvus hydrolyticus TaxID=2979988 RepID=A0AAP2Z8M6_9EURY|nr:hypothetical protein [Halobacteria archaeon AArc-curdl1]
MAPYSSPRLARTRVAVLVCADTLAYVTGVVLVSTTLVTAVSLAVGGGFEGAKIGLFLLGFAIMAYATIRLWPSSPEELERTQSGTVGTEAGRAIGAEPDQTRFQCFVRKLPPFRWITPPPPRYIISPSGKLFWSSVGVLLVSFLLETVLGVGA